MKIGVVMPVINQYEKATKALASIKVKQGHGWQPFIIPQWNNQVPLAAAWNKGIADAIEANCTYIVVTNDDVIFSPWTIDAMVDRLIREYYEDERSIMMVTGINDRGKYQHLPEQITLIEKPDIISESENPDFACFTIPRDFVDLVGPFDENFIPAYFEDNEMHYRMKILGYKAISTTAAPYYHYGSQSQNHSLGENKPLVDGNAFEKNRAYLMAKWGTCDAHKQGYEHPFNNSQFDPWYWTPEWRKMVLGNGS